MQRLIKIASFLLLAIWLPATLHCDLEAAGLTDPQHTDCCATDNDCKASHCANIESSLIRESAPTLSLVAPAACNHLFCLVTLLTVTCDREATASLGFVSHVPPLEITAGWQFLTRAAPPSRAPSLNA